MIIKLVETNQIFLLKAFELQNRLNIDESINTLEKIYKNFHTDIPNESVNEISKN